MRCRRRNVHPRLVVAISRIALPVEQTAQLYQRTSAGLLGRSECVSFRRVGRESEDELESVADAVDPGVTDRAKCDQVRFRVVSLMTPIFFVVNL